MAEKLGENILLEEVDILHFESNTALLAEDEDQQVIVLDLMNDKMLVSLQGGKKLQIVEYFTYLGSQMRSDARSKVDIIRWIKQEKITFIREETSLLLMAWENTGEHMAEKISGKNFCLECFLVWQQYLVALGSREKEGRGMQNVVLDKNS